MATLVTRRSWPLAIAAVLGAIGATIVVLVIIASTGGTTVTSDPATFAGVGFVSLECPDCEGHEDIHSGTSVVIVDGSNNVLGFGVLAQRGSDGYVDSVYPFRTEDIPAGKGTYGVKVANRNVAWMQESEIADHGFAVRIGS